MKYIALLLLSFHLLMGDSINLSSLLNNIEQIKLIDKSIKEEAKALEAKSKSEVEDEPFVVSQYLSKIGSSPDNIKNGIDTSISKNIKLGNIKELEARKNNLSNQAYLISKRVDIISLKNDISILYHQYCLGESYLSNYKRYYSNIKELYRKKQIAYSYDDIAKTELLQVEFEKKRQNRELNNLIRKQQNRKEQLLNLGGFSLDDIFKCSDLYPINAYLTSDEKLFSISQNVYEKEQESITTGIERYGKKIESVKLSVGYNYEADTNFYTVGVEVPLEFTSKRNEYKKASLMYQHSANETKHKLFIENRLFKIKQLSVELKNIVQTISAIEENIDSFQSKLLPLINKSYAYGESSVMEYLLTQQRLNLLQQELLDAKESYYNRLFNIYKLNEKEDI